MFLGSLGTGAIIAVLLASKLVILLEGLDLVGHAATVEQAETCTSEAGEHSVH